MILFHICNFLVQRGEMQIVVKTNKMNYLLCYFIVSFNDPEPDVPKDVTPMAQCAFESLVFNVSAVYTN